jgi:hypothetical protein
MATTIALAIQLIPNPTMTTHPPATNAVHVKDIGPPAVGQILERSCKDCHSNETVWPWYDKMAPASWFVAHHISKGREKLNMSEDELDFHDYQKMCQSMLDRSMPLSSYTLIHPNAKASQKDIDTVCNWADEESAKGK